MKKRKRPVMYASYCMDPDDDDYCFDRDGDQWSLWKHKKDAIKGKHDLCYKKGLIKEICDLEDYVSFPLNTDRVYKITFKAVRERR